MKQAGVITRRSNCLPSMGCEGSSSASVSIESVRLGFVLETVGVSYYCK